MKRLRFVRPDGKWWKDFALLNIGTLLVAVGVYFFKFPNHFTTGGVSGISIVLSPLIPGVSVSWMNMILNTVLLLIGWALIGPGFGIRTAYSSLVYSLMALLLEKWVPLSAPLTDQPFLELLFAVGLPAVGSALLFAVSASSGGTDIIAMIIKKYAHMEIGMALMLADFLIAGASMLVFDVKTGLFSITGLVIKSILVNQVMENIHIYKVFEIVTDRADEICEYIVRELRHSATVIPAEGYYTHKPKKVLMTVVNRSQAVSLQKYVRSVDPHSFITIMSTSHIIGKGFAGMSE